MHLCVHSPNLRTEVQTNLGDPVISLEESEHTEMLLVGNVEFSDRAEYDRVFLGGHKPGSV